MNRLAFFRRPLAGVSVAAAVLAFSPPAGAQLNQPLHTDGWVLAAAHAPGFHSSVWRTDLWIYADPGVGTVNLRFCRSNVDNTGAVPVSVTFTGGKHVLYLEDVVETYLHVGDGSWLGSIHYTADVPVQTWARIYSVSPDGTRSYGQLVEGIPTSDMSPDTIPWNSQDYQYLYAMKHTADARYRVNVGIVNPTAVASDYIVEMTASDGSAVASTATAIPPYSMVQLSDPFAAASGGEWSSHRIRVICETDGGGAFSYASVVDNATNDGFFVRGVKDHPPTVPGLNCTRHTDGWILAAAHAPGLQDSIWRTDLWVRTASYSAPRVTLTFCRSGADNRTATSVDLPTVSGQSNYYFEDVVARFLGVDATPWLGAIHYTSSTEVQVWARVYSISPDGRQSYGQLVEGIPSADASPSWKDVTGVKDLQYVYAMKHTSDGRFRVNVGVINPTALTCDYRVSIWTSTGNSPSTGTFEPTVRVPPYSMVQLTDPYAAVDGGEFHDSMLQLLCDTAGGQGFLYASVVDNATNDAFFVRGIKRLPSPAR